MDILKKIFLLLTTYIIIVSFNILSFAYLYHSYDTIMFSYKTPINENVSNFSFKEAVYFSGITYFTIGYGDILPINELGKFLTVLQGFCGIIINSTFTGVFVYYLVKRTKNIVITKNIFIRYKKPLNKYYLSVRIGNKGRPLVNVNKILEIFVYENNIRKRKFHLSQEHYYFEKLLYWDIDLHIKENKKLLSCLKAGIFQDVSTLIRVCIIGTDVEKGELVFLSKYYTRRIFYEKNKNCYR